MRRLAFGHDARSPRTESLCPRSGPLSVGNAIDAHDSAVRRGVLDELGVLDTLMSAGAAPLHGATIASDDVRIHATADGLADHPVLCMRRLTLDVLLVEAASAAGAEVRTGARVNGLLRDGDRVTGVRTDKGTIHARLVVGADGRHSTVAGTVGAQEYDVPSLAAWRRGATSKGSIEKAWPGSAG